MPLKKSKMEHITSQDLQTDSTKKIENEKPNKTQKTNVDLPHSLSNNENNEVTSTKSTSKDEKEDTSKLMIIMRGLPGSGKSTKAKTLCPQDSSGNPITSHIFSSDDYFLDAKGNYVFTGKVWLAHQWNQNRVAEAITQGTSPIIVDNTHTQKWEAKPYVDLALDAGYQVRITEPDTLWQRDPAVLAQKNAHGVSKEAIQRMLQKWEDDFTLENVLVSEMPHSKQRHNNRSGNKSGQKQNDWSGNSNQKKKHH